MAKPIPDQFVDLHFPAAGVDTSMGFNKQPNRPVEGGRYARTCVIGTNVRGFEVLTNRNRGGQRSGLSKFIATPVVADWIIQELATIVGTGYKPPGGSTVQQSNSGRVVTVLTVSQGNVFVANPGDTAWTAAVNGTTPLATPPLNFTGIMFSAANQQKLWFADGVNWCYYDPSTNTVFTWTPATTDLKGNAIVSVLPVDNLGNTPRLIETWRGRTVVSGLVNDPQDWFMSAVNDPRNFDYSPLSTTPTQAVAGNNSPLGLVGDVITGFCPYSDDVGICFGDHTIWMFRGDPMAGGSIDLVSDAIGAPFGRPWCKDPLGNIYFVSNRTGIYTLIPGQQPQRISQAIDSSLVDVDTGANSFRLIWDDRFQGLHLFISPLAAPAATTHWFWESRSAAWWQDEFANHNHDPVCCCVFDGNLPGDRVPLIGSWNGYVRSIDPTATTDDGVAIASEVLIGPILTPDLDDQMFKDLQGVLGELSGNVTVKVYVGTTAEEAASSVPVVTGLLSGGRNLTIPVRRSGHACYVGLSASNPWQMETIRVKMTPSLGSVRRRGKV